ncbi:hypothetical protein BCR43DRAFT_523246 [Syncephalastrum racemosum]|uniref:3'-5' exonuclease domain-containing protein n=1 Tax=Syncephalastrum racemosum TaxID=13706 RepID=A0A1X2HJM1_SYNRA|nr:hypothetical protein BCR43DRAFT_523246 [Syncephalastrum racemosum]
MVAGGTSSSSSPTSTAHDGESSDDEWVITSRDRPKKTSKHKPSTPVSALTDAEILPFCTDPTGLIDRLLQAYPSIEDWGRLQHGAEHPFQAQLYRLLEGQVLDPGTFVLTMARYTALLFAEKGATDPKKYSAKFLRSIVSACFRAMDRLLQTPPTQYKMPEREKDLISFEDIEEDNLISFDDDDDIAANNNHIKEEAADSQDKNDDSDDDSAEDEDEDEDEEEEEEEDDDEETTVTLVDLLGIPKDVQRRYTVTDEHKAMCVSMAHTECLVIVVHYAITTFQLQDVLGHSGHAEPMGIYLCKELLRQSRYTECIKSIRSLNLFDAFPVEQFSIEIMNISQAQKLLPTYVVGLPDLSRRLLRFLNVQFRYIYAGSLDIVPRELLDSVDEDAKSIPALTRLRDPNFMRALRECAATVAQDIHASLRDDYYFIWLSQRHSSLRFMITERAIQQNADNNNVSIQASANWNGLILLLTQEDPVLAKLAIKELVDIQDPVAPAHFASCLKQQPFFIAYNTLPMRDRQLGYFDNEKMLPHRSAFQARKRSTSPPQEHYYQLPYHIQPVMVDTSEMAHHMQCVLRQSKICSLDTEWVPSFAREESATKTALLQIATDQGSVFLVDFYTAFIPENRAFLLLLYQVIQELFISKDIIKLAYDFTGDISLLRQAMPGEKAELPLNNLIDFKHVNKTGGLGGLVRTFLGRTMNKRQRMSNWEQRPLTPEQVEYACGDVYCLLEIYSALIKSKHPFASSMPIVHLKLPHSPRPKASNVPPAYTPTTPSPSGSSYFSPPPHTPSATRPLHLTQPYIPQANDQMTYHN